ncbi:MAG TPA: HD domain-containing phosphohydrolase [Nitrospirota bacterium]|nr:HD domain-containing phosphohydrolase [Nitrospirota bacterium]
MSRDSQIRLFDLITCLSDAMDFIDPAVVNHHKQVASIAYRIGLEMGLQSAELKEIVLAGALHDIGAFSLKERRDILSFEMEDPGLHAEKGFALLRFFKPLANIAPLVRFHHVPWNRGSGAEFVGQQVPFACHILHLADRVAVLIYKNREVLSQVPAICKKIREETDKMFMPRIVDAFNNLASKEYFWLDIQSPSFQTGLSQRFKQATIGLTSDDMMSFSGLFSRIIDFKSAFTATHSSGVAAVSARLSQLLGFTESECRLMLIAGHLHDLGKLAVPSEIIEKPSGLQENELNVMRHHTYYTYRILETIPRFQVINKWASFHHERLDGSGYPFHLTARNIPRGSQIMAVADVFTAITEDRPYRRGMTRESAAKVLDRMARDSALSREIVAALNEHYEEVNTTRIQAQASASADYESLTVH